MHIKRILIIDDSPVARMLLKKCLGEGFEIFEANSGKEGLDLYSSVNTDIIFLDLIMPGKSGIPLLKEFLMSDPEAKIIILTAHRQKRLIRDVMRAGALAVLQKPPRQEIIGKTLHSIEIGDPPKMEEL